MKALKAPSAVGLLYLASHSFLIREDYTRMTSNVEEPQPAILLYRIFVKSQQIIEKIFKPLGKRRIK